MVCFDRQVSKFFKAMALDTAATVGKQNNLSGDRLLKLSDNNLMLQLGLKMDEVQRCRLAWGIVPQPQPQSNRAATQPSDAAAAAATADEAAAAAALPAAPVPAAAAAAAAAARDQKES